jgi:16S rRNA (guanine527-N7)-methyltransferase
VLELLAADPASLSSIRDPAEGWRVHVADSLSGLELVEAEVERASEGGRIADVGAGAGFPGMVLAAALPGTDVELIESVGRKCDFMRRAIAAAGIENATVVCGRAEDWARERYPDGGREAYDVVAVRAVGRMATLAELASPLLRDGGALIAWKGRRDAAEEAELERAAARLGMESGQVVAVGEESGARNRHLHVVRKSGPTPAGLPRRAGMAKKRPYGVA